MNGLARSMLCLFLGCLSVAHGWAGQLTLGTNAMSGSPLIVQPGTDTFSMLVNATNNMTPTPLADFMAGWQTQLMIVPDPEASGMVAFGSVAEPVNYVFQAVDSFGLRGQVSTTTNTDDTLLAFDFNFPFSGGVEVPISPGANLVETTLIVSPDASGTFVVVAAGGLSEWTDSSQPTLQAQMFQNVSDKGGTVRIGEIVVEAAVSMLQAGDSDQDLDFDQFDIVRVQQSAKYLTGESASWGDGDWNGAPGGSPGNPPRGDGIFNQLDLVAALVTGLYRTGPYAARVADEHLDIVRRRAPYRAGSGDLALDATHALLAPEELASLSLSAHNGSTNYPSRNVLENPTTAIPEPSGLVLLLIAALVFGASRRFRLADQMRRFDTAEPGR